MGKVIAVSNHKGNFKDNEKMQELVNSISTQGILTPVTVREDGYGQYEMISGHRRMHAATVIGMDAMEATGVYHLPILTFLKDECFFARNYV